MSELARLRQRCQLLENQLEQRRGAEERLQYLTLMETRWVAQLGLGSSAGVRLRNCEVGSGDDEGGDRWQRPECAVNVWGISGSHQRVWTVGAWVC